MDAVHAGPAQAGLLPTPTIACRDVFLLKNPPAGGCEAHCSTPRDPCGLYHSPNVVYTTGAMFEGMGSNGMGSEGRGSEGKGSPIACRLSERDAHPLVARPAVAPRRS